MQKFGREVLSYPLLVEAIETEFIPLLIYNNRGGVDAQLLKRYQEPSWNYQVVRFLDSSGKDIIPRKVRVWTRGALARRMIASLKKYGRQVPQYLEGIALSEDNSGIEELGFSMFCYWTGEMELGALQGVVRTEAGHLGGQELTRVWFDPKVISLKSLAEHAQRVDCARAAYVNSQEQRDALSATINLPIKDFDASGYHRASDANQKRQLRGTPLSDFQGSEYQRMKLNAFIRKDPVKAYRFLSPRQRKALGLGN